MRRKFKGLMELKTIVRNVVKDIGSSGKLIKSPDRGGIFYPRIKSRENKQRKGTGALFVLRQQTQKV